jgi:hypothetical protein
VSHVAHAIKEESEPGLIDPRLRPAIGLTDVGANLQRREIVHGRSGVITLIGDNFVNHGYGVIGHGSDRFELLGCFRDRRLDRRRVPVICPLDGDADNRARLEVDRVLRFMGQMRPTILRDLWRRDQ